MSLSTQEKELMQQALCAGAFGNVTQGQNGQPGMPGVNPQVLQAVAALTDEEARQYLRLYQPQKALQLTQQIASYQAQLTAAQTALTTLNAIVIAPPPVETAS